MRRQAARRAWAGACCLLLLAACSRAATTQAGPSATVATEPPRTTTTDPYTAPAVIDAAYVNRILAGLDAAVGDVIRIVVSTKFIPPEAYYRLRAVYGTDSGLQIRIDLFQTELRANLTGYRPSPGNLQTRVSELLSSNHDCVFAKVDRDYSAVTTVDNPNLRVQWVGLRPLDPGRDPNHYNPTGWAYFYDGFERGFTAPASDLCARS